MNKFLGLYNKGKKGNCTKQIFVFTRVISQICKRWKTEARTCYEIVENKQYN